MGIDITTNHDGRAMGQEVFFERWTLLTKQRALGYIQDLAIKAIGVVIDS